MMQLFRVIPVRVLPMAVAVLLATYVLFGAPLFGSDTDRFSLAVIEAESDGEANMKNANGAPQQQVVNGWIARDLLIVQAGQMNELIRTQNRTNGLLWIAIVGFAATTFASCIRRKSESSSGSDGSIVGSGANPPSMPGSPGPSFTSPPTTPTEPTS